MNNNKGLDRSLIDELGIGDRDDYGKKSPPSSGLLDEEPLSRATYQIVPHPKADAVDLSELRGVTNGEKKNMVGPENNSESAELENLAEILPDIRSRRSRVVVPDGVGMTTENLGMAHGTGEEVVGGNAEANRKHSAQPVADAQTPRRTSIQTVTELMHAQQQSRDINDDSARGVRAVDVRGPDLNQHSLHTSHSYHERDDYQAEDEASGARDDTTFDDYPDSEAPLDDEDDVKVSNEFVNMSSGQSISTATQTHEVRMPMYLPTFKPATGCTNASDFIVRCFVARLRAGITVVKHGRSRWCKSRLRVLHIHPDGRSLSWKPAEGEPNSSKRPPKLDLSTCLEVRHAWSPDPQNPMYTGTPILRQKCEAANAHKSFALIFRQRTVDITAVTADQCKVLMEGFSALCFRLHLANLAGRGTKPSRPMPEDDGVSVTASATLTNTSVPRGYPR